MNRLLTALLIINAFPALSQTIESDQVDEFDKTRIIKTKAVEGTAAKKKDYIDENNEFLLMMLYSRSKDGLEIYALTLQLSTARDVGCLSEYDGKMIILFENDSTLELSQITDSDCSDPYVAAYVFANKDERKNERIEEIVQENFAMLFRSNVKKIRVYASRGYIDATMKPDKKNIFALHAGLIRDKLK